MTPPPSLTTHPYLRAATAGVRHHARSLPTGQVPADRGHIDVLHAHLTTLHQFLGQTADDTRPPHPAAGRHLINAQNFMWQAATEIHSAFHQLPAESTSLELLPGGPAVLTICQRHLAAGHRARRKTTPSDLTRPAYATTCAR